MILTIFYIILILLVINVLLLVFSCNSPDDEALKSYRFKMRLPKQRKYQNQKSYHLAADK